MRLIAVTACAVALLAFSACGDGDEVAPTDSATPTTSATPGETEVSWGQAKQLLRDCRVTAVGQAHSLDVWLTLEDGTRAHAKEPGIDDVIGLAFEAQGQCGGQPEQIVTE
jgi:hypothetical protein